MKHSDFAINHEFFTATGKWVCTDKGTRVITAIKIDSSDPQMYIGPPYKVEELVFDEYDLPGCHLNE